MQAILVADYSFTPAEYWRNVSVTARQFINRCLTIDSTARMTAHQALAHPWITGVLPEVGNGKQSSRNKADLLPTVKKNFNARRTLHAAIDTIRAINQLRAGGAAALAQNAGAKKDESTLKPQLDTSTDAMEGVERPGIMPASEHVDSAHGQLPPKSPNPEMDPRGNGHGQTEEMIQEQMRRIRETSRGLWEKGLGGLSSRS